MWLLGFYGVWFFEIYVAKVFFVFLRGEICRSAPLALSNALWIVCDDGLVPKPCVVARALRWGDAGVTQLPDRSLRDRAAFAF